MPADGKDAAARVYPDERADQGRPARMAAAIRPARLPSRRYEHSSSGEAAVHRFDM
jgi:hypothetical protein